VKREMCAGRLQPIHPRLHSAGCRRDSAVCSAAWNPRCTWVRLTW